MTTPDVEAVVGTSVLMMPLRRLAGAEGSRGSFRNPVRSATTQFLQRGRATGPIQAHVARAGLLHESDVMDDEDVDRLMLMALAADPRLVPGIYNFCDRRCDRCGFTTRCLSYLDARHAAAPQSGARPERPGGHVDSAGPPSASSAADAGTGLPALSRALQIMRVTAERHGSDFTRPQEDRRSFVLEYVDRDRRAREDRVVAQSRHYALTAWPIARALWPIVVARGDERVMEALETIAALCTTLSSKTYRAILGTLDPGFDAGDLQSDANGSAKIARLIIADSRRAWTVLMETGRATANGVPAKLVLVLNDLDAALATRFPRAMAFVRPGFDADDLPGL
jgi:hypothetical protein